MTFRLRPPRRAATGPVGPGARPPVPRWSVVARTAVAGVAAAAMSAGCQTVRTTEAGTIGIDRIQRMSPLVSEAALRDTAVQQYRQTLSQATTKGTLNADAATTARVRAIAARLVPASAAFREDARRWAWEVNVIRSDELNAWCMPGGKIAVYSGLVTRLALTDDEIAAVLGHEIAHALREHARERVSEQATTGLLISGIGAVTGATKGTLDLGKALADVTFSLPNSRAHETEADRIGVEIAARAGYDPRAAITLWQKMGKVSGEKGGVDFLSTHPSPGARLADLQIYAKRVMPLYEQRRAD